MVFKVSLICDIFVYYVLIPRYAKAGFATPSPALWQRKFKPSSRPLGHSNQGEGYGQILD